ERLVRVLVLDVLGGHVAFLSSRPGISVAGNSGHAFLVAFRDSFSFPSGSDINIARAVIPAPGFAVAG
ncbi:hypothetical protein ACFY9S_16905, partial [Streptomyces sp. NPDC012474]|uniref:hypothetical protein n=1 Tax=Streptomyces sp. NPDC012474 TaxID=3364836 RepID=UPI0036EDEF38